MKVALDEQGMPALPCRETWEVNFPHTVPTKSFGHVRIFCPLPHTGDPNELQNIEVDKSLADEL